MKINFFVTNPDVSIGSYRIWIRDLSETLKSISVNSSVKTSILNIDEDADVVILSKGNANLLDKVRSKNKNSICGIINLSRDSSVKDADFIIAGSVEEKASLYHFKNPIIYPLIEMSYKNVHPKIHKYEDTLRLCYHGSYTHLSKFYPHLINAINQVSSETNVELHLITNPFNLGSIADNFPKTKVIHKHWNIKTFMSDVLSCDVGIVPNITDLNPRIPQLNEQTSVNEGLYSTDYNFRMKNKSNAGRAFVFHQLGIPVVADLTPSHVHVMGNPDCGYLVNDWEGWYNAFIDLLDFNTRNTISQNAYTAFNREYDEKVWAKRLVSKLKRIKDDE